MTTIHDEARELYKRIARRHKTHPDPLDKEVLALLAAVIPMIPEAKAKGLHPLHRELILGFQDSIRTDRRDKPENTAFAKIADIVTPEDVALLKRFYKLPGPKPDDYVEYLSNRVKAVDTLMNSYTKQLEYAEAYFKAHPYAGKPLPSEEQPKEPEGWAARAPGTLGEKTWNRVCIEYPEVAAKLVNGEDLKNI